MTRYGPSLRLPSAQDSPTPWSVFGPTVHGSPRAGSLDTPPGRPCRCLFLEPLTGHRRLAARPAGCSESLTIRHGQLVSCRPSDNDTLSNRFRLKESHSELSLHRPPRSGRLLGPGTRLPKASGPRPGPSSPARASVGRGPGWQTRAPLPGPRREAAARDTGRAAAGSWLSLPSLTDPVHTLRPPQACLTLGSSGPGHRDGRPGGESAPVPTRSRLPPALREEEFPCRDGEATAPLDLGENSVLISGRAREALASRPSVKAALQRKDIPQDFFAGMQNEGEIDSENKRLQVPNTQCATY